MKKIIRIFLNLVLVTFFVVININEIKATCRYGILNNGLGGIYISVNSAPYTTFQNYSYGQHAYKRDGCAWFASARVNQLTGKGNTIRAGTNWWEKGVSVLGTSRGQEIKAPAIMCWGGHVAILEKIEGSTAYVSEGGSKNSNNDYGYTIIRNINVNSLKGMNPNFLGFVYLTSNNSIPNAVTNLRSDKKVYNTKEYIKFNWDPSYGTENYWVYLWKNGVQLYSLDCGKNTSFTSAPTSSGKYTLIIRPGNKNGFNEKSKSYSFVVTNDVPEPVTNLRSDKKVYNTKEYIKFNWDPSYGTENYWVYLWKNGVQLYSLNCGNNTSFTSAPTSPGKYTLIIRPGNINGFNEKSQNYSFVVEDENSLKESYSIHSEDYNGVYDGRAHTIVLNGIKDQSIIKYSIDNVNWTTKKPTRTDVGTTVVYYQITSPDYKTITGNSKIIIQKRNISQLTYSKIANQIYTGFQIKPSIIIKAENKILQEDIDYTLSYGVNTISGEGTVKITGKGNYTGTITKFFTISKRNVLTLSYSKVVDKIYTGKQIKPSITVKDRKKTLKSGTDYTLSYKNNKNTGKATITIKGKGNYSGSKTVNFYIVPKKVTISSVKPGKKQLTVKYKKVTGASGYQIAYSTSKSKGFKYITVNSKTASKVIKKLKSKKNYYVKVRAYKTVGKKKYYGAYSNIKNVKVK